MPLGGVWPANHANLHESSENSPAFQRWALIKQKEEVPSGTTEPSFDLRRLIPRRDSFVPEGTRYFFVINYPALKRWAIFSRNSEPHDPIRVIRVIRGSSSELDVWRSVFDGRLVDAIRRGREIWVQKLRGLKGPHKYPSTL